MAKPKGSKFWDSSSSSDSESTRGSDGEDVQPLHQGGKRFDDAFESDSESEDEARVVKSHKDKAWDTFKESIVKIRNAMKTHDWTVIHDDFELVNKQIEKSKMLIAKEGLPKFYIKMLGDVEDFVLVSLKDKEAIKKMKKNVALALNRMKLVTKKHNLKYKDEIADYRANPDKYQEEIVHEDSDEDEDDDESDEGSDEESEESDEDSDESEEESDESEVPTKSKTQLTKKLDRDDSDDDSLFESEEEESSSSDESEEDGDRPELKGRAKWLKKAVDSGAVDKKEEKKLRKKLESRKTKEKDIPEAQIRKSAWKMEDNLTEEALDKKVNELVASRGKKGTDVRQLLRQLEMLAKASRKYGPNKEIPVLMHLMSFMFDSHRVIDDYLEIHRWRTCHRCLTRVVQLLEENQSIVLTLFTADDVMDLSIANKKEVDGEVVVVEKEKNKGGLLQVVGNIEAFVSRLDDEYMKSLQQINPHTKDYIIRLSDEAMLSELAESVHKYYTRIHDMKAAATVALLQVEHLYYKHDSIAAAVQHAHLYNKKWGKHSDLHPASIGRIDPTLTAGSGKKLNTSIFHPASYLGNPTITTPISNPGAKLDELCSFIYTYGDERHKTRALLCAVYHHALHDRYYQARDLFLISHIQDSIDKADTNTQILYNRALVTMGLAAFRLGLIQKAHDCLSTICSGRVRELLAQGQSRWAGHDRDPEQEKLERRRQMPYHMHINPELLDCCHLISAMLLELPHMVKNATGSTTIISRTFRKYLQAYNRQVFTGPPENTREHVMAAAKCMMTGDWARACGYIVSQEVWNLLPNDGGEAVKEMLRNKLREESLRIYLLSYSSHYESMSLQQICDMFVMDAVTARRIISRMIFQKEIYAAWDQPPDTLLIYKVDATPAQALSQQLADKLAQLVENNERILDTLGGSYNYKDDWSGRGGADQSNRPRSNWKSNWNSSGQQQQGGTSGRYSGGGGRTGGYQGRGGRGGGRGNAPGGGGTSNWGSGGGRGGAGRGGSQDRSGRTGSAYSSRQYQQRQQSFGTKVEGDLASKRGPTRN